MSGTTSYNLAPGRLGASPPKGGGPLDVVVKQIQDDTWRGRGPGVYTLPGVLSLHAGGGDGLSLPTLRANGRPVGYLHGYSDEDAAALRDMLKTTGRPLDIEVQGHYGSTNFYIDRLLERTSCAGKPAGANASPLDGLDADQCERLARDLTDRARVLRSMQPASEEWTTAVGAAPEKDAPAATATARIERDTGGLRIGGVQIPVRT